MTPPTPEQITALEQWAKQRRVYLNNNNTYEGSEWFRLDTILALCETVREMQAEVRHLRNEANGRQCPTCAGPMTPDGCGECAAAVARAEKAERERDAALDMAATAGQPLAALSMPQVHRNADVVKALRQREIDAKQERDAYRAEVAQLRGTVDALTNGQLGQMREEGQ